MILSTVACGLTSNLWVYTLFLFCKGICCAAIYQSAFIIGVEYLGGSYQFWGGNLYSIVFVLGVFYISLLSWMTKKWRYVELYNLILVSFSCTYAL